MRKQFWGVLALLVVISMIASACATPATSPAQGTAPTAAPAAGYHARPSRLRPRRAREPAGLQIPDVEAGKFNVGAILIGPHDDGGWSQAHYDGLDLSRKERAEHARRLRRERARRRRGRAGHPRPGPQGLRPDLHDLLRLHGPDRDRGRGVPRHDVHPRVGLQDQQQELRQPVRRHGRHEVPGRHGRRLPRQGRRHHQDWATSPPSPSRKSCAWATPSRWA